MYIPVEIYLTIIFLLLKRIENFENYLLNVEKSSKVVYNSKILNLLVTINSIIKSVNKSLSMQIMIIVFEIFIFGLVSIFSVTLSLARGVNKDFIADFLSSACYAHLVIFQISYFGAKTKNEVIFLKNS